MDNYNVSKNEKITDKRENGFYCQQCKQFQEKSVTPPSMGKELYINDEKCLVNTHYCGCRGWN